ncbi:TetR/AcrR family transcriptional regulator [Actinomadura miaoliensis]|uniref:TetR/AcrR family transcriptional regulator C-terminal domain-containing protein n=1 Tax=Actinomadura miaoliensis TaxID=430685 RepID=A0ABP7VCR1_9ACTN
MADAEHVNIWMLPERPARGPRPAYSRAQITEAAVRIADAEGLDAASMRRIAAEIGAGAMSLYRYVPSRTDLIELMIDHALGEMDLPEHPSGDWRADVTLLAGRQRAMLLRHPWMLGLRRRPGFGPNQLRLIEFGCRALDFGQPIDDILAAYAMLNGYVEQAVAEQLTWIEEQRRTGLSREDVMVRNSAYVRQILASGEYPMFIRIIRDAVQPHMDDDRRFHYGLDRVMACMAAILPTDNTTGAPADTPGESTRPPDTGPD